MKKSILLFCFICFCSLTYLSVKALSPNIVAGIKPNECKTKTETIISIKKGDSQDIVFSDNHGDHYYISGELDCKLNLESLNTMVLNKTVTLHLPKLWLGTSEYIAQLSVGDNIIFTEFK